MSVPGRRDAAALLLSLDPPRWHRRHSRAVAEVAAWLARAIQDRSGRFSAAGRDLDRRLVETAALLHDVDKALPPDDPFRRLRHGEGSGAWLAERGYPELAPAVAAHPVTRLVDEGWFRRELLGAPLEVRIVAYADKRAGQRLEPMEARFASWTRRYPPRRNATEEGWDRATLDAVWARARLLEADVCAVAGIEPDQVERLGWTGPALRAAEEEARGGPRTVRTR